MLFIYFTGKDVTFINEGIQYQMPLLLIVIVVKFIILLTFLKWIFGEVVVFLTAILDQRIPIGIFLKAILITNYP